MKFIKQLTCLIACFVVLSSSFITGYAVGEDDEVIFTADDLIEWGWHKDEDNSMYYASSDSFNPFGYSTYFSSYINFPGFDINSINWASMPKYITDIVYMDLSALSLDNSDELPFKLPFVMVMVKSSIVEVVVGCNLGFGVQNNQYTSVNIFSVTKNTSITPYACMYTCSFSLTGKQLGEWLKREPMAFGSRGNLNYYYPTIITPSSVCDLYFYGGNGVAKVFRSGNALSSTNFFYNDSETLFVHFSISSSGLNSSNALYNASSFPNVHVETFSPKTLEQVNQQLQQEQNGLLEDIFEGIHSAGESDFTTLPDSSFDDYNKAESDLVDDYNPDDLEDDLDIDFDNSALNFVWDLVDDFVTADNTIFTLFVSILSLGIIALILGR